MIICQVLSQKSPNEKSSAKMLSSKTLDVSCHCIPLWHPVWGYSQTSGFPWQKMKKGCYLGLAPTVGDAFCYQILTELTSKKKKPKALTQSIVQRRFHSDLAPIVKYDSSNDKLTFVDENNKEIGPNFVPGDATKATADLTDDDASSYAEQSISTSSDAALQEEEQEILHAPSEHKAVSNVPAELFVTTEKHPPSRDLPTVT